MNAQRQKAYLKLIQALLNSPDEQKTEILVANQGLFDADFLKIVEDKTEIAFQQKDKNRVSFLRDLHSYLKGWFYWHFLNEVLQITASSQGKVQVVLALLETNIEKLDYSFLETLQEWTISALEEAEPDRALSIAEVVINFCSVIQEFHLGDRSCNIEIAIAGYEVVLTVINRTSSLNGWAIVQTNLGKAYCNRIQGNKAENLELAIQYYTILTN